MTNPTNKHRETARGLIARFYFPDGVRKLRGVLTKKAEVQAMETDFATTLATTEADAYARAKAEAAEAARRHISGDDIASRRLRESLTAAILADSGLSLEQRIRAEAKAEDAEIAQNELDASQRKQRGMIEEFEIGASYSATIIRDAILASSPGPALEERIRAEIAEAVEALTRHEYDGHYLNRDDVLAAITADATYEKAIRTDERRRIEREILDNATEVGDALSVVRGEK